MTDKLVKHLLTLTDILVEIGDTGWANTTRAAAERITEYDYDLAEAWEEGHEAAAMRVPEGVWHDVAAPRPTNPYKETEA